MLLGSWLPNPRSRKQMMMEGSPFAVLYIVSAIGLITAAVMFYIVLRLDDVLHSSSKTFPTSSPKRSTKNEDAPPVSHPERLLNLDTSQLVKHVMDAKTHYNVLGVNSDAEERQLTVAFRLLAKKLHPDKNSEMDTHAAFTRLQEAIEVLSDPGAREEYDEMLLDTQPDTLSAFEEEFKEHFTECIKELFPCSSCGAFHRVPFCPDVQPRWGCSPKSSQGACLVGRLFGHQAAPGDGWVVFSEHPTRKTPVLTYYAFYKGHVRNFTDLVMCPSHGRPPMHMVYQPCQPLFQMVSKEDRQGTTKGARSKPSGKPRRGFCVECHSHKAPKACDKMMCGHCCPGCNKHR